MNTAQIQLKISLSRQLSDLLASKAARVGVPVTQLVKHLILKEVEDITYPTFRMSQSSEDRTHEAIQHIGDAVDADVFFRQLHES